MGKLKTLTAWLLTALFLLSAVPVAVSADSGVVSVTAEDVTLVEYADGVWDGYFDSIDGWVPVWYQYVYDYETVFTVEYADGSVFCGDLYDLSWQFGEEVNLSDDQSEDTPWGLGDHTVNGEFLGFTFTFTVTVEESPIASVTADDVVLFEHVDGYSLGDFFYYLPTPVLTVTYKDGTVITGNEWEIYEQTGYFPYCYSTQDEDNPWGLGDHTATVEFMNVTADFTVTIVENPIASVAADDVVLIEHADGYLIENFFYYLPSPVLTVTYKDGTVITGDEWEIYEQTGYFPNCYSTQDANNPWGLGDHAATVEFMNVTADFTVTVVENPIASIAVDDLTIAADEDGYWTGYFDENGNYIEDTWFCYYYSPILTVTYKDGTVVSGDEWEIYEQTGYDVYFYDDQSYETPWSIGEHVATAEFMGLTADFTVTVTADDNDVLMGDVTGDGALNMMDALILYTATSGASVLTETQTAVADLTGDGVVNMMDVLILYNTVSGS